MKKEKNMKKAFLWNMIGSTCYSVSSFLYLLVVTRLCGVELAGFFSLSYATAQLLLNVGRYGMRTYQATDLKEKYTFAEYSWSRVISCSIMMLLGIGYSWISFEEEYIIISIFIILMKMIDAVEDVFHGNFQQNYQVATMGKMLTIRNVYSASAFILILLKTRDLRITCTITALSSLALCLAVNLFFTGKIPEKKKTRRVSLKKILELMKTCTPLFMGTFLSLLLYNTPKYAMANVLTDDFQTYYSIMFMPSFVLSLMCEFLFKPMITTMAAFWMKKETEQFIKYVTRILSLLLICCCMIVVGGHLLGRTLLEIVYGVDLSPYKAEFVVLLSGGGISALVYMLYNILIAIRKGACIVYVYGITAVLSVLPARWMVQQAGIMGASCNFLLSASLLFVFFISILCWVIAREKKNNG